MTELLDRIIICLEQRKLFSVSMMDITMELVAISHNDEVDFGELLTRRGDLMTRVDKCTALINNTLDAIPSASTLSISARNAVGGRYADAGEFDADITERLLRIQGYTTEYMTLLRRLEAESNRITDTLKTRHGELRDKLNAARSRGAGFSSQSIYRT